MGLEATKQVLKEYFGYDSFRPMQQNIIEAVMDKKDVLVLMPTGGGKSLCYQVPAMVMPGVCVVVSPLIALMKDQVEALRANGIQSAFLNSTQTSKEQEQVENACIHQVLKLLYVSPEKLLSPGFFNFLKRIQVNLFAVDEAHCISSWGHDFRPEYTQLKFLKEQFPEIPVIALTATADKLTRQDIVTQLKLEQPETFVASFDRPNIFLQVRSGQKKLNQIMSFLDNHHNQPGIIYCLSRNSTETVAAKLVANGYNASYYHAGLAPQKRASVQEQFLKDNVQIICATIAFGMGIDKSNVRWVMHYNMPKNLEGYYQEIGRAGRDGAKAEAVLFYSFADVLSLRTMLSEGAESQTELQLAKLERMQQYAEATFCRRRILLQYFGESVQKDCGKCDVCLNPPQPFDGTLIAQKALSAITRLKEKATLKVLIDVLRGSRNQLILSKGFDKIKTFGAGADLSFLEWQSYLQQFLNAGIFDIAYDDGYTLKLNETSNKVLFENQPVKLVKFNAVKTNTPEEKISKARPKKELQKDELFERLRKLRKQLADERNVPPYVIFTDSTLLEMAAEKPTNRVAMLAVSGVGMQKYETYGYDFMNEILSFMSEQKQKTESQKGVTHLLTLELLQKGMTPEQIAAYRNLSATTIYSHIATLYEQNYQIDLSRYLGKDEYLLIEKALIKLGAEAKLKEIFDYLGQAIDYFKIRLSISIYKKKTQQA